jgi:hypothetical protein
MRVGTCRLQCNALLPGSNGFVKLLQVIVSHSEIEKRATRAKARYQGPRRGKVTDTRTSQSA